MRNKGMQLEEIHIDQKKKAIALEQLRQAVKEKEISYSPSVASVVLGQMKYLSLSALGGQLICLLLIFGACAYLEGSKAQMMTWLGTGSVFASILGVFLMLELCRSSSYHMLELEQSCYLNIKQLWCVKMLIFGSLDLLLLTVLIGGISKNVSCGLFAVALYLLVPFVVSSGLQLLVFTMFRRGKREYLQMCAAVLVSLLSLAPLDMPELYTFACLGFWGMALLFGTVLLIAEIVWLYRSLCSGGDLRLMDLC